MAHPKGVSVKVTFDVAKVLLAIASIFRSIVELLTHFN